MNSYNMSPNLLTSLNILPKNTLIRAVINISSQYVYICMYCKCFGHHRVSIGVDEGSIHVVEHHDDIFF
jgi:hypothetical protein